MTQENIVWARVKEISAARGIQITQTTISFPLDIDRKKYKAGIAALAESRADESACFAATMNSLESDLEVMRRAANAWAIGNLGSLGTANAGEFQPACKLTYDRLMGFQTKPEIDQRADAAWLSTAKTALNRNQVTFAVLPLGKITGSNNVMDQFRSAGFQVYAPDDRPEIDQGT